MSKLDYPKRHAALFVRVRGEDVVLPDGRVSVAFRHAPTRKTKPAPPPKTKRKR